VHLHGPVFLGFYGFASEAHVECLDLRTRRCREIGFGPVHTAPRPPSMRVESADVYEVLAHFIG
jgi:hypothetical protein